MDRAEIIAGIKKRIGQFTEYGPPQDHADEIRINVDAGIFTPACRALHHLLNGAVAMLFASDERKERAVFVVRCVFLNVKDGRWVIVSADIPERQPSFDSLAKDIYSASLFEREIREMFGIEPVGSPDLRRLNLHDEVWPQGSYPLRKDFSANASAAGALGEYKFAKVEGDGVFEVPVGPVHAGIIGPGHFRFSVAGEPIVHLEPRLGFTHRGVEKLFEGLTVEEAVRLSQRVSGDSAYAHNLAFVMAAEKIACVEVPHQAAYIRAVFLELERMYNHANDISGIALDVGFSFPAAYAAILKESILQLNEDLTSSRYLKNVTPVGGVSVELGPGKRARIAGSLKAIKRDFAELVSLLYSSVSFMDRVDTTGVLRKKTAEDLGVLGVAGRASGVPVDIRKQFPGVYKEVKFKIATQESGDVLARLRVRISEFKESCRMVGEFSGKITDGQVCSAARKTAAGSALGYVEGWRGPVLYWLETDGAGVIKRCKIVDPSFHNWQGLSYAVLGNIIPDFPVCNKSFDLSYSGNDL